LRRRAITAILHQVGTAGHIRTNKLRTIRRRNADTKGPWTTSICPHDANREPLSSTKCDCGAGRRVGVGRFQIGISSRPARIGISTEPDQHDVVILLSGDGIFALEGRKKVASVIDSGETYGLGVRGVYVTRNTIIIVTGTCIVSIVGADHERGAAAREF
jgi:hypothetical protein